MNDPAGVDGTVLIVIAILGAIPLTIGAYASVVSAIKSSQTQKETQPNGGGSMRDEIVRIATTVESAETHARQASHAAAKAEATARTAAEGVARADAFHLYMHDRVHDLGNAITGNRGQIVMLRSELGLVPHAPDRREKQEPILPDRLYPPMGQALPDPFAPTDPKDTKP